MNQLEAIRETWNLVRRRSTTIDPNPTLPEECNLFHMMEMMVRIERNVEEGTPFSPAKLGRWLGWLQCAATSNGYLTLEEAKEINKRHAVDAKPVVTLDREKLSEFLQTGLKIGKPLAEKLIMELRA